MEEKSRIQKENCFAVSVGQEWGTETVIPVIQQRPLFFPSSVNRHSLLPPGHIVIRGQNSGTKLFEAVRTLVRLPCKSEARTNM